jgi:transcription antitermination factor NusG
MMLTNLNMSELVHKPNGNNKNLMVIYTKSRREKKVADYCNNAETKYYLPLESRTKIYGRKKVQTTLPLFPGYLFVLADEKERYELLLTHHISKILKVSNQLELIEDLEKIYIAESCEINLIPCELNIEGRKARIKIGPMRGLEGLISSIKGRDCIILNVNFINRAAAVEINRSEITLLN